MLDLSKWEKWVERPSCFQRDDIIAPYTWDKWKTGFLAIRKGKNEELWMESEPKAALYKGLAKQLLETTLEEHLVFYQRTSAAVLKKSKINTKLNNKQLAAAYREFCKANDEYAAFYLLPFVVDSIIDEMLREKLKEQFGADVEKVYRKLTSQTTLVEFQEMQLELKKLRGKYTQNDLKHLVEKWSWQGEYSLQEDLFDEVYFEEQIKQSANIDDKIVDKIMENKKAFEETLKTLDANTQKLAQIVNKYVVLRTHRIDIVKKFLVNMRQFYIHLTKLLQGNGFTYNEIINLTRREIVDFLEKNISPNLSDTKKRVNGEVAYLYKGKAEFIPIAKLQIKELASLTASSTKGKIANTGTATGPAVIVKTKSDLLKVRSGCVLVAKTTYPEYTPFMKKAVAIVTDEGGVTSHAAIVSRELGIPCIVGTRNASKIFTDNELIFVNAEKGIVEKA